jgi:hypothetical protein
LPAVALAALIVGVVEVALALSTGTERRLVPYSSSAWVVRWHYSERWARPHPPYSHPTKPIQMLE